MIDVRPEVLPLFRRARRVADAVLYEGYVLYPYRASAPKNRLRWQFGVLVPPAYTSEPSRQQTECIVEGSSGTIDLMVRFLHAETRTDPGATSWDEGVEQHVALHVDLSELADGSVCHPFELAGAVREGGARRRQHVTGEVILSVEPVAAGRPAQRLRVVVANTTALTEAPATRDEALRRSLIGVHTLAAATGAEFVSSIDPPQWAEPAVAECRNEGAFPVLVGPEGDRAGLLSSPVILYDHPQIAPESPGDLYDATEIDEILTLRTLTLTDEEKREARATDPRAAAVIDRVDGMDAQTLGRLHGTFRDVRTGDAQLTPRAGRVDPATTASGPRVRLRPRRRADAQDMFLAGRVGIVHRREVDVDGTEFLAVTIEGDPAAELHDWYGRYHYFTSDEVEPIDDRAEPEGSAT